MLRISHKVILNNNNNDKKKHYPFCKTEQYETSKANRKKKTLLQIGTKIIF